MPLHYTHRECPNWSLDGCMCHSGHGDPLTIFMCGPNTKCEHDFSGWQEIEGGGTAICSKCGALAIDEAMWE